MLPVRSAPPPTSPGTTSVIASSAVEHATRVAIEPCPRSDQVGSLLSQPSIPRCSMHAAYSSARARAPPCSTRPRRSLPLLAGRTAADSRGPVVLEHVVGHEPVLVRLEPDDLLDRADLVRVLADRFAVRARGVGVLRRRVTDVAAQHDDARALRLGHALADRPLERVEIVGDLTGLDDVPAVRLETQHRVVGERELGRAVDRDVVVVVDRDEPAQPEVAGERAGLVAHALLETAVAHDGEDVVVGDRRPEPLPEVRLREREPDRVGDALAERTGGHLDARGVSVLGVPRRARAPLPELLDVGELEPEPGQVQVGVEEHRRVAVREHEPVPVRPVRRLTTS